MTLTVHLTFKNFLSLLVGVCIIGLGLIPVAVPPDRLAWLRWQIAVLCLALTAIISLIAQSVVQSKEDEERDGKEQKRDKIIEEVRLLLTGKPNPAIAEQEALVLPKPFAKTLPAIDGEVYRIAESPRSVAWPLVKDIFRLQGRPGEAKIDTDILVEMYLVNTTRETKYVRDIRLSVSIAGQRIFLERQNDLAAEEFNGVDYDYGIKPEKDSDTQPIKLLASTMPLTLQPEQPIEGWIRFLGREINPDAIDDKTWEFMVIDSLGTEYAITKASSRAHQGELGLVRPSRAFR